MKRKCLFFAVLVTLLALVAGTAQARAYGVPVVYCVPGQTKQPDYQALVHRVDSRWDLEDYSLSFEEKSDYLTVDADGTLHISEDAPLESDITLTIKLKPRKSGESQKQVRLSLQVLAPIEDLRCDPDTIYLMTDTNTRRSYKLNGVDNRNYIERVEKTGADLVNESVISVSRDWVEWRVQALKGGKTGVYEATYYTYDGQQATVRVHVLPYATKLEFAREQIDCVVQDAFDLGLDLGVEPNGGFTAAASAVDLWLYDQSGSRTECSGTWVNTSTGTFTAMKHGHYKLVAAMGNMSDTMYIHIYDDAACQSITVDDGSMLYPNRAAVQAKCLDASGNHIVRPLRIVDGADIVTLEQDYLTFSGTGKFTLEAQNPDGSTCTQTFDVVENPTEVSLNAVELTLDIGQTFDLKVSFDKGEHPYQIAMGYGVTETEDKLASFRLEGNRVIAQAPGQGMVYVTAYGEDNRRLTAECKVTVLDSDQAIRIVLPDPPVGVGQEALITVQDKTGKVYPGTYTAHTDSAVVYPDGRVLGVKRTGQVYFQVDLDDGRVLKSMFQVLLYPKWLKHDAMTIVMHSSGKVGPIQSDVGEVPWSEVTATVADPSIADIDSHTSSYLTAKQPGVTTVTLKSKYTDASVTFTVEVVDDKELFAEELDVRVPYGYYVELPQYVDAEGNPITIDWAITYDLPGEGNPEASGFLLQDGTLSCTWPTASCVVTGRTKDNITLRINAIGYLLPESISIFPANRKINGQTLFRVLPDQEGTEINLSYWTVEDESILTCDPVVDGDSNVLKPRAGGTTRVMVMLNNGVYTVFEVTVIDPLNNANALPGDVNTDKTVDNQDALLILQHIAGWGVDIHHYNADVDANGRVTVDDATLILQKLGGMKVLLRKYEPEE